MMEMQQAEQYSSRERKSYEASDQVSFANPEFNFLKKVAKHLDFEDLMECRLVCKSWRSMLEGSVLDAISVRIKRSRRRWVISSSEEDMEDGNGGHEEHREVPVVAVRFNNDILKHIFDHLDFEGLKICGAVCSAWRMELRKKFWTSSWNKLEGRAIGTQMLRQRRRDAWKKYWDEHEEVDEGMHPVDGEVEAWDQDSDEEQAMDAEEAGGEQELPEDPGVDMEIDE